MKIATYGLYVVSRFSTVAGNMLIGLAIEE